MLYLRIINIIQDMDNRLNSLFENCIRSYWDEKGLSDYKADTYTFEDIANIIIRYHLTWEKAGFEKGFRVAICGRNCSQWTTMLISCFTYGAVAVPLLNEFTAEQIHRLVNHSDSKLLFVSEYIWNKLDINEMPGVDVVMLDNKEHDIVYCRRQEVKKVYDSVESIFTETYPNGLKPEDVCFYRHQSPDELLMINYTSGTTSEPKGVMIPERAVWSNMEFAKQVLPQLNHTMSVVSLLPTAHVYGMAFEVLYEFIIGVDITFITRALSPAVILQAMADVKPCIVVVVPMIIEKVVRKGLLPKWNKPIVQTLLKVPGISSILKKKFRDGLIQALGGNFYEVIIGGAALNPEVEDVLKKINFPYTVGYGMTECAPIICYSDWKSFAPHSCGRQVPRMEVKVNSNDPFNEPGEIVAKGMNVMLGYYKNEEATKAAIDEDGWLHTGDMGVTDEKGNIFIKGRFKTMLLSGSGQNIYPEEIENEITTLKYVTETIVVQRDVKLVSLIYPDRDAAAKDGLTDDEQILKYYESQKKALNSRLAAYSHIAGFELVKEEFEKTPKKSIKRFLYS